MFGVPFSFAAIASSHTSHTSKLAFGRGQARPHGQQWTCKAGPHNAAAWPAGCTYDGYRLMYCTGRGETYKETVPAKGHAYSSTATKAATCTGCGQVVVN